MSVALRIGWYGNPVSFELVLLVEMEDSIMDHGVVVRFGIIVD